MSKKDEGKWAPRLGIGSWVRFEHEIVVDKQDWRRRKLARQEVDGGPAVGVLVGARRLQSGRIEDIGDGGAGFHQDGTLLVALVRRGWLNRPRYVLESDLVECEAPARFPVLH